MPKFRTEKGDYILSFAVVVQSLLMILQQCLIGVFNMPPESTTVYRIVLSAIPVLLALYYIWNRRKILLIVTYAITILILLIHTILFPDNELYIRQSSLRFLLPILLPTFLAVVSIRNFQILVDTLYYISWCTLGLVLMYALSFFVGRIVFEAYNMSFSYGALIPALSLYSRKTFWSIIASFFMLLMIVALGSRGAAIIFVIYLLYDFFINNKRFFWVFLLVGFTFYLLLPYFIEILSELGITSRTLSLLLSGNIDKDSGRTVIYHDCLERLMSSPIMGLGLFGDRVILNGTYCHNIFLEMAINFGLPLSIFLILGLLIWIVIRYFQFNAINKTFFMMIVLAVLLKLFVSNSYLESYDFALLIGMLYRGDRKSNVGVI